MTLAALKMPELREYAKSIGVQPQQHESRESLLTRIAMITYPDQPKVEHKPMKEPVKPVFSTADEVLEKLSWLTKKGGTVTINEEDGTWHATYRGVENSGSLSMPLNTINRHVELYVGRGAILPRKIQSGELAGALAL